MGASRVLIGALLTGVLSFAPQIARAETVYEFAINCQEEQLATCFDLIRDRLTEVKDRGQGRAFCAPRIWGMQNAPFGDNTLSVIEHIRLTLSAARFGKAEMPVDDAISDILKTIYPCE